MTNMALNFIGDDAEIWYDVDGIPLKWYLLFLID
jgi:autophagy-related protein 5